MGLQLGIELERSTASLWDLRDKVGILEEERASKAQSPSTPAAPFRTYPPPVTPRHYATEPDEEPFLDTAPSSPQPRKLYSSGTAFDYGDGLEGVEVFEEGERVGVGVWLEGRGGWARDCFADGSGGEVGPGNGVGGPGELEVVRRLGEGTYAIVYLVREVLYDPTDVGEDVLSPIDPFASFSFDSPTPSSTTPTTSRPRFMSWASDPFLPPATPTYGRNFALKCLCKKDLSPELVEIQRGEAVLHRALPDHEFIVRLYGAYETDDWLFLVLEYCPGQDLYYWLDERADDSEALYDHHSRATSPFQDIYSPTQPPGARDIDEASLSRTITASFPHSFRSEMDFTPPSPSLLASTADASLLSRKRLRLISRMFGQMCSAVQACHEVGISHRDIKPENFIVMDGRGEFAKESGSEGDSRGRSSARVTVKITDWGLGTRETECEDFDCGSKPYMAYECRNNLSPTYDPRQADVWSLGLVLLNLLYHRNPWADPSLDDPDFAEYVKDPRGFLQDRFEGIGEEVAGFLSDRVFCDTLEIDDNTGELRKRVTAGEFGKWAGKLGKRKRASVSDHTFHLVSSVSRPGPGVVAAARSTAPSLLSQQFAPTSLSLPPLNASSPTQSPQSVLDDLPADLREELPVIAEAENERLQPSVFTADASVELVSSPREISPPPIPEDDEESLPSPTFPPSSFSAALGTPLATPIATQTNGDTTASPTRPKFEDRVESNASAQTVVSDDTETARERDSREEEGGLACWGEPESQNPKSRRRKRGARKGRSTRPAGDTSPPTPSPLSPGSPINLATVAEGRGRPEDLAAASQELARALSKATTRSTGTQSAHADYRSTSSLGSTSSLSDKKPPKSGGVFGRMRGLVMDGNQDLNALRQRHEERNASMGINADTYSAPAKMQGSRGVRSGASFDGTSSWGSVGVSSMGSVEDGPRGRTGSDLSPDHWSSASSRRERQQRRRHPDFSPSSSTRNGGTLSSSTFESRNHTPLSSFSSVASTDSSSQVPGSLSTVRDWRQPSPNPRAYSNSRAPHSSRDRRPPDAGRAAPAPKPVLRDASTDTADLGTITPPAKAPSAPSPVPSLPLPVTSSLSPPTTTPIVASKPLGAPKVVASPSPPPPATPSRSGSTNVEHPVKTNKLAKMLNSISVFNRGQETR
ncbi:protein serine/threonine kinase [Pseudohyphozyma bogoriensis]|nr:protein serine/threonine kinase [Pseudohyphozyma bogoriensis]